MEMATPFGNNFDPFAQQRRIMEQMIPRNPLADFSRTIKQITVVDPTARHRELMEKIAPQKPLVDFSHVIKPVIPPDPLALQRQLTESVAKNSLAEYSRVIEKLMAPSDPFAQQRRAMEQLVPVNPIAEYSRILNSFRETTGGLFPATDGPVDSATTSVNSPFALPEPAIILHLLSVAWICLWLVAEGANAERLGALVIDALALAERLSKTE